MITWDDFEKKLLIKHPKLKQDFEEIDRLVEIIVAIVNKRNELGYSQRDLAKICGLPHSSIARIEAGVVSPNLSTLFKILRPLHLSLVLTNA